MSITWCNGWQQSSNEKHRVYIERELCWELDQVEDHPLRGRPFRVVGALNLYHDFILLLEDDRTYGYVRLVWKPAPPLFEQLGDDEAVQQFIREWRSPEPAARQIKLSCPSCGQELECEETQTGAEFACPTCERVLNVPLRER